MFTKNITIKFLCLAHPPMPTHICSNKYFTIYHYIFMVNLFNFLKNIIVKNTLNVLIRRVVSLCI